MTEMQAGLYTHFLTSNAARRLLAGQKAARVLSAITGTLADTPPVLIYLVTQAPARMFPVYHLRKYPASSSRSQCLLSFAAVRPQWIAFTFTFTCRPASSWHYRALCHTAGLQTDSRLWHACAALKKLCNHPKLIYDAMHARSASGADSGGGPDGFEVRTTKSSGGLGLKG